MNKFIMYLKESRAELMKVVWPSRKQTRDHTVLVVVVSIAVAIFLGAIDFIIEQFVLPLVIK